MSNVIDGYCFVDFGPPENFIELSDEIIHNVVLSTAHKMCYVAQSDGCLECMDKFRRTNWEWGAVLPTYECSHCSFEFYAITNECPLCSTLQSEEGWIFGAPPSKGWK